MLQQCSIWLDNLNSFRSLLLHREILRKAHAIKFILLLAHVLVYLIEIDYWSDKALFESLRVKLIPRCLVVEDYWTLFHLIIDDPLSSLFIDLLNKLKCFLHYLLSVLYHLIDFLGSVTPLILLSASKLLFHFKVLLFKVFYSLGRFCILKLLSYSFRKASFLSFKHGLLLLVFLFLFY